MTIREQIEFDGQPCTQIEVKHPTKKSEFDFHIARIYLIPNENPASL